MTVGGGEFVNLFGVRRYVTTCYTWTLVDVGILPWEIVRPRRSFAEKGSLPVISELLNMLLHVTPGRLWTGYSSEEGVRPRRMSGGEFVRQF